VAARKHKAAFGRMAAIAAIAGVSVPLEAFAQEQAADDAGAPEVPPPPAPPSTPPPYPQQENPPIVRADPYQQQWEQYRRQQWERYRRQQQPQSQWYGWQTLIMDGASAVLFVEGLSSEDLAAALGGLLAYDLGSPCIHWAHENVGAGFASLGLRVGGTFLVIAGIGSSVGGGGGGGVLLGLAVMILAVPIDAGAFAWEDTSTVEVAARQRHPLTELRIAPVLDAKRRSGALSMTGNF
jgi:hypothetical protein